MEASSTPSQIKRLVIEQPFGAGSADIDISFSSERLLTVLYGRNGSGKTVTLRLLEALKNQHWQVFEHYPFVRFYAELENGDSLELRRKESADTGWDHLISRVVVGGIEKNVDPEQAQVKLKILEQDDLKAGWQPWSPEDRLPSPSIRRDRDRQRRAKTRPRARKFSAFVECMPEVRLIETDRLREDAGPTVDRLSADVRMAVKAADEDYRAVSMRLDGSLSNRIFQVHHDIPAPDVLRHRYKALREREQRLVELGLWELLPQDVDVQVAENESQRGAFWVILQDREAKIEAYQSLVARTDRLLRSLNEKFSPKMVRLNVERGYQVFGTDGRPLELVALSSGEQHELVLLHELLFDTKPESLILIDEPELSLHVVWQEQMIDELLDIAKLANLHFVLATHSPYIVAQHEELMVRVGAAA